MARDIKPFSQYLKEQSETQTDAKQPLKGYTADQIIERISQLMEILSENVRFGVPSDTLGRATTYRDANGAIQKIKDLQHYYSSKSEEVRFYCWSISYHGSWKATVNLKKKIEDAGGFGEEKLNMNLKKVIDYFTKNQEDSDNIQSISISMDSQSIRKAKQSAEETSVESSTQEESED
jgi:hypothetical protein